MIHQEIISSTVDYVKSELIRAEGGHDWWHIERVWKLSKTILTAEEGNQLVVELGALLHDIADSKFHGGDEQIGPQKAKEFLESIGVYKKTVDHVVKIIENISFKGGNENQLFTSQELNIVQDADRLDAIGAIGIARAFNYGGYKNRALYNPEIPPKLDMSKEEYKKSTAPTINHFYEKLLLLKNRMNTTTGRKLAKSRHQYMEKFLEEFYAEWKGEQ